ncbi:uncharacterized protein LOC118435082 isoform X1 [Folsomia candida]|uniref:uncharacterized protein LOC118435082 isoform X1 n=1 Tax=Folsomia candida TaxID=158441 RepID=UPI0016051607|nr:uncharacterized protein LOC118435082 isoform X1 [Folsomia candida]
MGRSSDPPDHVQRQRPVSVVTTLAGTSLLLTLTILLLFVGNSSPHPAASSFATGEERRIMICSDRLLLGIQFFCRNPSQFRYMMGFGGGGGGGESRKRSGDMMMLRLPRLVDQEGYEKGDDDEEGDEADDDVVDDDGDELLREDEDSSYLDFRRKNIVDACCRNACTEDEFHQFCKLGGQGRPATTTTTTPPPPPPSRILPQALWNQLLSRHRLSLRSSTWGQEVVRSSPARTEDEIRVNLIREAVRCLYDPKCSGRGQVEGSSRRKGVGKKHRVATTNRTKNFGGGNAVGKIKTISPLVKSCSPTRRLQKMTKEEQSQIYPYLLRMLTWIIPAKPEQQSAPEQEPQSSPRIADSPLIYEMSGGRISPSSRLQIPNSSRFINGGTTTSGGIFGMPSFHRRTTHPTRSHATHRRPPHPEESPATAGGPHMKLSVVTDPPIETKVGFGLGTHEGVLFNN